MRAQPAQEDGWEAKQLFTLLDRFESAVRLACCPGILGEKPDFSREKA